MQQLARDAILLLLLPYSVEGIDAGQPQVITINIMKAAFSLIRVHAEFQLNKPPLLPFWFTPGQFLGNIVIRKDGSHVQSFHMSVPTNRSLNVGEYMIVQKA